MSASEAELGAQIFLLADTEITRGTVEEIAGIANESTIMTVPEGSPPATELVTAFRSSALGEYLRASPTEQFCDNRSLVIVLGHKHTKKEKALRRASRKLEHIRERVREGLVTVRQVSGKEQLANPLTKVTSSPTDHWRQVEWTNGSQPVVREFQEMAAVLAAGKKSASRTRPMLPPIVWGGEAEMEIDGGNRGQEDEEGWDKKVEDNTMANGAITIRSYEARREAQSVEKKQEKIKSRTERKRKAT